MTRKPLLGFGFRVWAGMSGRRAEAGIAAFAPETTTSRRTVSELTATVASCTTYVRTAMSYRSSKGACCGFPALGAFFVSSSRMHI